MVFAVATSREKCVARELNSTALCTRTFVLYAAGGEHFCLLVCNVLKTLKTSYIYIKLNRITVFKCMQQIAWFNKVIERVIDMT